jgi:hypothetical protein
MGSTAAAHPITCAAQNLGASGKRVLRVHRSIVARPRYQHARVRSMLDERCETVGQDFFASAPEAGDAYILAQILHDWDDERCHSILVNCRQAMRPGGKLLVVEQVLPTACITRASG